MGRSDRQGQRGFGQEEYMMCGYAARYMAYRSMCLHDELVAWHAGRFFLEDQLPNILVTRQGYTFWSKTNSNPLVKCGFKPCKAAVAHLPLTPPSGDRARKGKTQPRP